EHISFKDLVKPGETQIRNTHINVGSGEEASIAQTAGYVKRAVGYEGALVYDASKPDGTPRKLLDISKLSDLGWRPKVRLEEGIARLYAWYIK
ncbi:MAG: GDP-L-fucose synthase, partial [Bacteroidales bacterium]|nr:GDP-L-fucose synthase [Bacteroidales bacterium]